METAIRVKLIRFHYLMYYYFHFRAIPKTVQRCMRKLLHVTEVLHW